MYRLKYFATCTFFFITQLVFSQSWLGRNLSDINVNELSKSEQEDIKKAYAYIGSDVYWQSQFLRNPTDTYYGYYWNVGTTPLVGISYEPIKNIRLSLESRSDFNLNFQKYDAETANKDTRVSFKPLNQLALGLGYLF